MLLQRNILLHVRHELPVRTVAVPLRPEADSPALTGRLEVGLADQEPFLVFRYQVLRVWQMPPEVFLEGDLAMLPLATISNVTGGQLPAIIDSIQGRLSGPAARRYASVVWSATSLVMGLRYTAETMHEMLRGIMGIEESSVYQEIMQKGEARGEARGKASGALEEARKLVLKFGQKHLGVPSSQAGAALNRIVSVEELERLHDKVTDVRSWEDLLGLPLPRRKKRDG